ncbi:MAG: hypothetical protein AB8V23_04690 [Candidatus Midichloria sp.]
MQKSILGLKTQTQGIQSLKETLKMEDSPEKDKAVEMIGRMMQLTNNYN